jgi:hypothetical protein
LLKLLYTSSNSLNKRKFRFSKVSLSFRDNHYALNSLITLLKYNSIFCSYTFDFSKSSALLKLNFSHKYNKPAEYNSSFLDI